MTVVYDTSLVRRERSTNAEVGARRFELYQIVAEQRPMTVRQVYYQATVRGLVEKTEAAYQKVQGDLAYLRANNVMPFSWLADSTRWQRKPQTYNNPAEAIRETVRFYRRALWRDVPAHVEVWLEKDALSGVVYDVTAEFDVPLMVARGYSSWSFLHAAGDYISTLDVPAYIYHLGDFDPFGVEAAWKIGEGLRQHAPDAEIHFERLAVLPEQIQEWKLPTRPTKTMTR